MNLVILNKINHLRYFFFRLKEIVTKYLVTYKKSKLIFFNRKEKFNFLFYFISRIDLIQKKNYNEKSHYSNYEKSTRFLLTLEIKNSFYKKKKLYG
jgi:hypothetical protein